MNEVSEEKEAGKKHDNRGMGIMVMMDEKESGLKMRGISLLFCILSNGASIHMVVLLLPSPFPSNLFFCPKVFSIFFLKGGFSYLK